ncbi:MAG TPA: phosphatase PAP2 family protein [Thermoleophilia bacterium]|nr:phosphatase PAP2 family protein [Thermoleophilia bacterium]
MNARLRPTAVRLLNDARYSLAPDGGWDVFRQALIMLACYMAYDVSRALAQGREAIAMANGIYFMNLEKALGIWWEPWIQGRVSAVGPLMSALVLVYQYAHLPLIIGCMLWLLTQRRGQWIFYRNWFLAINFIAVLVFALLPTAPPRMILTSGVADMDFLHGLRSSIFENGMLANPFAAMPSLHFGYALFIGLMLYTLTPRRWVRYLGFLYASVVFVTIVATGNHFIVDAVAGALVVLAAWVFAVNIQPAVTPTPVTVRERDG